QDNPISWLDWNLSEEDRDFMEFVAQMIALRRRHPVFSRRRFLQGQRAGEAFKEVAWLTPTGSEMTEADWTKDYTRCLGVYLAGAAIERIDRRGRAVRDANFLVLINAHHELIPFKLPQFTPRTEWHTLMDTATGAAPQSGSPRRTDLQRTAQDAAS